MSVFSNDAGAVTSSFAPHEEFPEPNETVRRNITESLEVLTLEYKYDMSYDVVPRDMIFLLQGTYTPGENAEKEIVVERPDGKEIKMLDDELVSNGSIDSSLSVQRSTECRDFVYQFGEEYEDGEKPEKFEIDLTEVIFGKANGNILSDPEPLQGTYRFKVSMIGKDIQMDFGEEKTNLMLISKKPSRPRDLKGSYEDGKLELKWDEPKDKGGSDIVQYNVYMATPLHPFEYIGNVSGGKTSYTEDFDSREIPDKLYYFPPSEADKRKNLPYFRVVAVNKDFIPMYLLLNDWEDMCLNLNYYEKTGPQSLKEIVHVSSRDVKECDMS